MRTVTPAAFLILAGVHASPILGHPALAQPAPVDWGAVSAEKGAQFEKLLPDMRDGKICFSRRYDASHMRQHPDQQVTKLLVQIRRERNEGRPFYAFRLFANVRGRKETLYTYGECNSDGGSYRCGVECDGGGFFLERNAETSDLLVRIDRKLTMSGCEGEIVLTPGKDDKLFRLHAVDASACASLDSKAY